ncbi:MAG: hypothetical protein OQL16_02865 [Gammaproteobacteria bacterium]|nr:hypothetical protein [Gammaproteobacteria bacterium]
MMDLDAEWFNRLLLYAKSGELPSNGPGLLLKPLSDIGLIGEACHDGVGDHLPGDGFMNLLTFLGCSPDIALTPEDGENYCFIRLHEVSPEPRLYRGRNTKPPHCRKCKQLREDWQACEQPDYCGQCSLIERMENLVWRKQGAMSCWVIQVMNVYPHEAVPSPQLMETLRAVSNVEWGYAYLHRND